MIQLRPVQLSHHRFLSKHDQAVLDALNESRDFGVKYTAEHPTFTPRSGSQGLAHATTGQVIRTRNRGIVRLSNAKPYAKAIDGGARAHVIMAKRAKTLRFIGRSGVVFRKRVNHPGNKAYHFLSRATNAAGRVFQQGMRLRMNRIAATF
ncbi:MAG TPA: hypothetical protein VFW03_26570 [Gemmatimonadaceae bacterium]|nr:hypothetical protein [Gemmatimonadaceae bacterium]